MHRLRLPSQILFAYALNLIKSITGRVFFAVANCLLATPVISYTRTRMHRGVAHMCARVRASRVRGLNRSKFQTFGLVLTLGAVMATGLAASLVHPANAVASTTLNFQARLEGSDGAIAPDGNYNIQFKLYNAASGGTALWTEDHLNSASNGLRLVDGYLTVELGSVTAFPSTIAWDQATYVTMNIGGTSTGAPTYDGEMNPRLKLTAVPYAFQAKYAEQLRVTGAGFVSSLTATVPTTADIAITLPGYSGTVCLENDVTGCGFASAAGSTGYIQNRTTLQTSSNFNIQSAATGSVTAAIQALTGQTADLLTLKNSSAATTGGINASGQLYYQSGSFTGTLVQQTLTTGNASYTLPNAAGTQTICTYELANCAGAGSGITGTGTWHVSTRVPPLTLLACCTTTERSSG
jgi:hypothetical protein